MSTTEKLPEVMTDAEVAEFLRVPEATVRNYAARAWIPGRQIDGVWRFSRSAIKEWLAARSSREVLLGQVGAMEDDVQALEELRDVVFRDRGRPEVEREKD
jgi:hypothetical protein